MNICSSCTNDAVADASVAGDNDDNADNDDDADDDDHHQPHHDHHNHHDHYQQQQQHHHRMVSERPWVRVPAGPRSFSAPVTFDGSVWVRARAASSNLK